MTQRQAAALEGARLYVTHLRRFEGGLATRGELRKLGIIPEAKGGVTLVLVEWPDGSTARGSARCSPLDNYSKSLGRLIATGRALKSREVLHGR